MPWLFAGVVIAAICFWQDWRNRAISIWIPFAFLACAFLASHTVFSFRDALINTGINAAVISAQLLLIALWFLLRQGWQGLYISRKLGLGDIFWLYALCPFFALFNLIVFIVISLLISLVLAVMFKHTNKIPLAGYMALLSIPVAVLKMANWYTGYEDWMLLSLLQF